MKRYLKIIPVLMVILLPLSAEPLILTVEQAVELAHSNNFNLKIQKSNVVTKARAKEDAWNVFIPDVSAGLTLNRSNSANTVSGATVMGMAAGIPTASNGIYDEVMIRSYEVETDPWTLVGNLSAQLVLSPAIGNGITQLLLDYRDARLDLRSSVLNIVLGIKKNFYGILLVEEQIEVLKRNILTMENRLDNMKEMYGNGYITRLDLLKTQAGLSSMGPTLTSVENNYKLMLMNFRMDLGLDLDEEIILKGSVEASPGSWDADELVEKYLPGRIDIQQLLLNRDMLENARSATFRQSRLPSLIFSWSYNPYQADPFEHDSWGKDAMTGDNGTLSISLSLPLDDWLPRSATDNELKKAREEILRLDYQREMAIRGAELEIRSLVMNLNTSREILEVLDESVFINQESLTMSRESYNNGGITLLELETAENDLFQAENDLLGEKYNYISALLDLEVAINRQLENNSSESN